jgi:hypothetical protein
MGPATKRLRASRVEDRCLSRALSSPKRRIGCTPDAGQSEPLSRFGGSATCCSVLGVAAGCAFGAGEVAASFCSWLTARCSAAVWRPTASCRSGSPAANQLRVGNQPTQPPPSLHPGTNPCPTSNRTSTSRRPGLRANASRDCAHVSASRASGSRGKACLRVPSLPLRLGSLTAAPIPAGRASSRSFA